MSDTGIEPNFIGSRNDYALAARSWPLGLAPGRTAPYPTEPDSATLRSRGAFKGLCWPDARQAANAIATDIFFYGGADPRTAAAVNQPDETTPR